MPKDLKHYGIPGMRWGHRKPEETSSGVGNSKKFEELKKKNSDLLKKNPNAAVVNYEAIEHKMTPEEKAARQKKIRNIAIGVGVGLTLVAGAVLYAKNKKAVDDTVANFLGKNKEKKLDEFGREELTKGEQRINKLLGVKERESPEAEKVNHFLAAWLGHDKVRYAPLSDKKYAELDTKDIIIEAGRSFQRIAHDAVPNGNLHNGAYVSYHPDDNRRYMAFMKAMWSTNDILGRDMDAYKLSIKSNEIIKSPSARKRVDILAALLTDKDFCKSFNTDIVINEMSSPGATKFRFGVDDPVAFAKTFYNTVATNLLDKSETSRKYKEKVISLGYNALVDDNDAGRLARMPMILLKGSSASIEGSTKITKEMIKSSLKFLEPMDGENWNTTREVLSDSNYRAYFKAFMKNLPKP